MDATAVRLPPPLTCCGKHFSPTSARLPTGIGVHLQTGMRFGFTTKWCSASDRDPFTFDADSQCDEVEMDITKLKRLLEELEMEAQNAEIAVKHTDKHDLRYHDLMVNCQKLERWAKTLRETFAVEIHAKGSHRAQSNLTGVG
jgi:hypothetical protein